MTLSPTRIRNLLRVYGLTANEWLALIASGRCPLCQKRFSATRRPVLDHRHRDGLIRGAVCAPDNYRLGILQDDDGWLQRAADYLTDPPAVQILGERYVPGSPPRNGEAHPLG